MTLGDAQCHAHELIYTLADTVEEVEDVADRWFFAHALVDSG